MFRSRCHRPEQKSDSIEYSISSSQISFLLLPSSSSEAEADNSASTKYSPYFHPALFTFPSNAALKLILSQEDFINLASKHSSIPVTTVDDNQQHNAPHFELEDKILDENLQFSSIILIKSLVLVINDTIRLTFHESKHLVPDSATLYEHRKGLSHRLPVDNGHRPKSGEQRDYPNESLDLLFDTLHGDLSYLTEYLKSHWGERHEFTIYPIQQEKQSKEKQWNEWETGIYKMCGDVDGTVNIALASDWYRFVIC
jgi:hypothetical protein